VAQARDAAVRADLAKSRFLASASHDLRQPLQSLSLNGAALSRLPLHGTAKEIVGELNCGIEALRKMLDSLMDVSTLDSGAVTAQPQPIPLARLCEGVLARLRPHASAKGLALNLQVDEALWVWADAELLPRMLSNLVDNAIKFTPRGGVDVRALRQGEQVELSVADSGVGIAEEDQERIFEDLVQLHNPQRDRSLGHGLGLGIVRRLAALQGIGLAVHSQPGQGSRFSLTLKACDGQGLVQEQVSQPQRGLQGLRVLVLDDDPGVRGGYHHALTAMGCEVALAATSEQALALLPHWQPQLALVDYRLAEALNGLQVIEALRSAQQSLAAVIVSADTGPSLRLDAQALGVPVLRKPLSGQALAELLEQVNPPRPQPSGGPDTPDSSR
jgi:two-component system, sensor histidine kinase